MLLAVKRAWDLVRAGRRVHAQWAALPDEHKRATRAEADRVATLTGELARRLGNRAAERINRGPGREGRDIGAIAAELSDAIARLRRLLPETGLKPSRTVRLAGRAAARLAPARPPAAPAAFAEAPSEPPPASFAELERRYAATVRSGLGADGVFWEVVPEAVEWRVQRGGQLRTTRTRRESLELAWPDGRTESIGAGPAIYVFTKYDQFCPTGCIEATRDFNVKAPAVSVRDAYARETTPPCWIGLLRREDRDDGEVVWSFASYTVEAAPADPPAPHDPFPRTPDRAGGSLEGTGWIKPPPGVSLT